MGGRPMIMLLANAVLDAADVDEAERAFAALAATDIDAANALAHLLIRAMPGTGPMWTAIMRQATTGQLVDQYDREERTRLLTERPKPFRWTAEDAAQTADSIDRFLRREGPWRMRA